MLEPSETLVFSLFQYIQLFTEDFKTSNLKKMCVRSASYDLVYVCLKFVNERRTSYGAYEIETRARGKILVVALLR